MLRILENYDILIKKTVPVIEVTEDLGLFVK